MNLLSSLPSTCPQCQRILFTLAGRSLGISQSYISTGDISAHSASFLSFRQFFTLLTCSSIYIVANLKGPPSGTLKYLQVCTQLVELSQSTCVQRAFRSGNKTSSSEAPVFSVTASLTPGVTTALTSNSIGQIFLFLYNQNQSHFVVSGFCHIMYL